MFSTMEMFVRLRCGEHVVEFGWDTEWNWSDVWAVAHSQPDSSIPKPGAKVFYYDREEQELVVTNQMWAGAHALRKAENELRALCGREPL